MVLSSLVASADRIPTAAPEDWIKAVKAACFQNNTASIGLERVVINLIKTGSF